MVREDSHFCVRTRSPLARKLHADEAPVGQAGSEKLSRRLYLSEQ